MKRATLLSALCCTLALSTAATLVAPQSADASPTCQRNLPDEYSLPEGISPEGIARKGHSSEFFVGSISNGGIYQFDAKTGEGEYVVAGGEGRMAIGLSYDARSGLLYVAGGRQGMIYVYNPEDGELVAELDASGGVASFVNDVIVTKHAVLVTDSIRDQFYRIPLSSWGTLPDDVEVETIQLGGDYEFVEGEGVFNANGIEAPFYGRHFLLINSQTGLLYRVNSRTGIATEVDTGDTFINGDGLLLQGRRLYIVQNFFNQISVVNLSANLLRGELVDLLVDDDFDIPTTTARYGSSLLSVNARFATPDATEFTVVTTPLR